MNHADWRTTTDAGEFLAQAGPYLDADPIENTLLLTIAHGVLGSSSAPAPGQAVPLYGWHPASPLRALRARQPLPARRLLTAPSFTPPECRSSSAR